jgi:hypothetical protein
MAHIPLKTAWERRRRVFKVSRGSPAPLLQRQRQSRRGGNDPFGVIQKCRALIRF